MRLFTLFEQGGEYIPFDRSRSSAYSIGSQLARAALAKTGGNRAKAAKVARKMADKFNSDVAQVIDDELGVSKGRPTIDISA